MRTYDDTFSGQKIYPGKVRFTLPGLDGLMEGFRRRRALQRLKKDRREGDNWNGGLMDCQGMQLLTRFFRSAG